MRRFLTVLLLCLCLWGTVCRAEIPCECGQEKCTCFIQLGDGGPAIMPIQEALVDKLYLSAYDATGLYNENTMYAVMRFQVDNALPESGMMDDETLTLLLWGMLPEELDAEEPTSNGRAVWIPTGGGMRRHVKPTCSGMEDPRRVSVRNAQLLELLPCGKCNKDGIKENMD